MTDREQFDSRVVPVMDRVREELRSKQAEELSVPTAGWVPRPWRSTP